MTATVTGATLLFPVIGHPARQVRAPSVFNALFARGSVDALCFGLDLSPEAVFETCRALLHSPSVGGVLVTVPYKKVLAALADRLSPTASRVGAVNALRRASDGRIEGELLDGLGFVRGVQAAGHAIAGKRVLLLGAGGAGSAIAAALAEAQAAEVAIHDPQANLAHALASRLQPHFPATALRPQARPSPAGYDLVVNASPLGLRATDPLPLDPAVLDAGTLVCDVIMEPPTTRFLLEAQGRGLTIHRGRHMLDHQVPAYLSFFGQAALAHRVRVTADAVSLAAA